MTIDPRGPRFGAAITTLVLAVVPVTGSGWLLFAAGATVVGMVFAALVLTAAFLNEAFDFCLGCHMYLLIHRIRPAA